MTEIQEVDVFVKPDGTVRIEVRGVRGVKCLRLTEEIEQLLGARVTERAYSDEFNLADQEIVETETLSLHTDKGE